MRSVITSTIDNASSTVENLDGLKRETGQKKRKRREVSRNLKEFSLCVTCREN